jgi:hypothetical protein
MLLSSDEKRHRKNKMTNTIQNKMKKGAIVAAAGLMLATTVNASNTADITAFHRHCPIQFYTASADSKNTQYLAGIMPFGSKCSVLGFGLNSSEGSLEQIIVSGETFKGLDVAADYSKFGNYPAELKVAADYTGKNYGFGAIASENKLSIGARASYKGITAFAASPVMQEISPTYGITVNTALKVEASYNPETKNYDVVISKAIPTKKGTFIPQITTNGKSTGISIAYIPGAM